MPRTWFVCLTIVAAFASPLFAAAPPTVLAPVPGPVLAVARTWGLEPARDRVRFLPELVRLAHAAPDDQNTWSATLRRAAGSDAASEETAVVPLGADVWSAAVFRRQVALPQLLTAILLDRNASLLAAGLSTLDDETLSYLGDTPQLLTDLYLNGAGPFAAFAAGLAIRGRRVIAPGGPGDQQLWAAVVGAPLDAPDQFVRLLFTSAAGRLAYLYSTVAALDAPTQRFVFGDAATGRAEDQRRQRLRGLAMVAASAYGEWKPERYPYARPLGDLGMLWLRLRVDDHGVPLPPNDLGFWADVWRREPLAPGGPAGAGRLAPREGAALDALWLAEAVSSGNMFSRADRLDQLAFAQRVFPAAPAAARADIVAVVQAFPRQKMLMLTLERMGLRAPALYAFVSRQASALPPSDPARAHTVMAQLQPALALIARMTVRGSVGRTAAERLVRGLFAVPVDHDQYGGAMARWIRRDLAPLLPEATDLDTRVLLALAGPMPGSRARRVEWEGERYRLDFAAAELRRLQAVRAKQGGATLECAVALEALASRLADAGLQADGIHDVSTGLQTLMVQHAPALTSSLTAADAVANGVILLRPHHEAIERASAELDQAARARDVRRAARQAGPLQEVVDLLLGQALLSTAYAADLGDPDGAALLSRNAALRHDFGVGRTDGEVRGRLLWALPRQDFQPGVAWHVTGSALGLDLALARLGLRRLNLDRVGNVPRMTSVDREGFAVGHALLDVQRLRDDTRDAIASALSRGLGVLTAAARDRPSLEAVADRLRLTPLRRRSLLAAADVGAARLSELLTLIELLELGDGPSAVDLAAWGVNALPLTGCPCTQIVSPRHWPLLMGRAQLPLASAAIADLNLRIAAALADLQLPAALAGPVLALAIQDFLEDAQPSDSGDWWGLALAARTPTRERIEDYVAATAGVGGVLTLDDEESKEP